MSAAAGPRRARSAAEHPKIVREARGSKGSTPADAPSSAADVPEDGRPPPRSATVVAVDTGGTFTDLLVARGGSVEALKVPSTPGDPAEAVLAGLVELLDDGEDFLLLHGSTVATNTLLERSGARVALVTNAGFEDVIEIGRQNRPQLYALVGTRPPPLVDRDARIGLIGRIGPDGEVVEALDAEGLERLPSRLPEGTGSVAVCLLHSYADPSQERAVAEALGRVDLPVSLSSELLPEYREYERTATTVVNAYVAPAMGGYLRRLDEVSGSTRTSIMGSGGGSLPVERAQREPAHTILSGPAGGTVAALEWGRRAERKRVISFDMGGTSTDVSLCPGRLLHTRDFQIAGTPVALPFLDIHTVGAGGGSIARVDAGGALRVGPESAGSEPGPIAYGRGGRSVTVTDAHVWLGRIPADTLLAGDAPLDRAAIEAPLAALAGDLGTTLDDTAEGIVEVADTAMERALRVISVERGHDPSDFALVAFGGAGALHVAELAARLGAERALVPPDPGVLSAWGMLVAPVTRERSRTVLLSVAGGGGDAADSVGVESEGDPQRSIARTFDELEGEARGTLEREGYREEEISVERWVEARYRGQSFELRVPGDGWLEAFHRKHRERYGYERRERAVEAVTLRAVASAPGPEIEPGRLSRGSSGSLPDTTPVRYRGARLEAAVGPRDALGAGDRLEGPLLLLEYSATTWVPPQWAVSVDDHGILHLTR